MLFFSLERENRAIEKKIGKGRKSKNSKGWQKQDEGSMSRYRGLLTGFIKTCPPKKTHENYRRIEFIGTKSTNREKINGAKRHRCDENAHEEEGKQSKGEGNELMGRKR